MWKIVLNFQAWLLGKKMQLFLGFFYFNANANSIPEKPVDGKCRIPIFLSSSASSFFPDYLGSQFHRCLSWCLAPFQGF